MTKGFMRKAGGELRQTKEGEETQRREDDVKVAETRVMHLQAKEHQGLLAPTRS